MPAVSEQAANRSIRKFTGLGIALVLVAASVGLTGCVKEPALGKSGDPVEVRIGFFPNVTHAQALIGFRRGDFQKAFGDEVKAVPQSFNAGPSAIEAIYAGHIDIAYLGPSPALNGFLQSKGEEVRVIAGSALNGVTVVGSKVRGVTTLQQLEGGRVATPQYANTQDISARYFLGHELGFKLSTDGGKTDIIPISNPDIETLFAKNQIDGAWVPEPWGTRLIKKNLVVEIVKERDLWPDRKFAITTIIARCAFVNKHPRLLQKFLKAHILLTHELEENAQAFAPEINAEIERITSKALPEAVLKAALDNTAFDVDPQPATFQQFYMMGQKVGIIKAGTLDVGKLMVTGPLNAALAELGEPPVKSLETTGTSRLTTTTNFNSKQGQAQ